MKRNEAWELALRLRYSMKIQNAMGFADTNISPPDIDLFADEESFFDSGENRIHIGVFGVVENYHVENEEELLQAINFVRGHEEEHCRSTSLRPYAIGIQKGCEEILKYISTQVDKVTRRFRTPSDYEHFANVVLPGMGIYINWRIVHTIVAGIANSLEDGRIERIRAARFPGFENLRIKYRGRSWVNGKEEFQDYAVIEKNTGEKLRIILNQVLNLSKCQLYQMGFAMNYSGTPLMEEVKSLLPFIRKAYMASKCKGMSEQVIEISRILAPYIYEVSSFSEAKAKELFEKLVQMMMESAVEKNIDNPGGSLMEKDEMEDPSSGAAASDGAENPEGAGTPCTVFKKSDLFGEQTQPGEDEKKGTEEAAVKEEQTQSGEDEKKGAGEDAGKEEKKMSEDGKKSESDDKGQKGEEYANASDSSEDPAKENTEGKEENTGKQDPGGSKEKAKGSGESNGNLDDVLAAMQEAAEKTREEAKEVISNINTHIAHEHREREKENQPDREPPLSESEMAAAVGHRFKELKRAYKVTDKLPPVLQARGRAMYRKNQRYFRSLSRPTVKNLDSGSVDPSRIYGLSFGDTEVFQKLGKDKKFDGCAYMLIDNSGSMAGTKRIESAKAGAVVEEGFRKMFPLKIVAFDEDGPIIHEVIKNWDEWLSNNCCWNYALHGREGFGNEDGYDIKVATRELLARPEKKMLVILSDGAPGSRSLVKQAVKDARKKGIEVYSIYFEEGEVDSYAERVMQEMYEHDYVVCPLTELDEHLYKLFKKFSRK